MCRTNFTHYNEEMLLKLKAHYNSLSEKASRHFLALEFERLGAGSKCYLNRIFGCSRMTIIKGVKELSSPDYANKMVQKGERSAGGGRKKKNK